MARAGGRTDHRYDKDEVKRLFDLGLSDKDIAQRLGHCTPTACRTVQKIRIENGWKRSRGRKNKATFVEAAKIVDQINRLDGAVDFSDMTPEAKIKFLKNKFDKSTRCTYVFKSMSAEEILMFQEEYFNVVREVDDLSAAEEQSLFVAVYGFVLAFRAQRSAKEETEILEKCRKGKISRDEPEFIIAVNESHERNYDKHMKLYSSFIEQLKLSRRQRLDKEVKSKKSFIDFVYELADKDAQQGVAEEIRKLEKKSDDELKRLLDQGLLLGYFIGADNG